MRPLYFDHNATTPLLPEVVEAMMPFLTTHFGNPSSGHAYGKEAKKAVEQARAQVAALVDGDEVIFTSSGTEATSLALRGTRCTQLITSAVEHPATARVVDSLEADGLKVSRLSVDEDGLVRPHPDPLPKGEGGTLVSIIHAHNETGVLQSLREFARPGSLLHVDAAQSAGKVPLSMKQDGIDLITLVAHKLYGPKGVGALVVKKGVALKPVQLGAGQERGLRAGTENVASIVGFGAACVAAKRDLAETSARMLSLRDRLISALRAGVPGLVIAGEKSPRLPNTIYALFPNISGSALLAKTPGIAASTGSACHDGHETPPLVLLEMKVPAQLALGAVRLSLGRHTSEADVDSAAAQLISAAS